VKSALRAGLDKMPTCSPLKRGGGGGEREDAWISIQIHLLLLSGPCMMEVGLPIDHHAVVVYKFL
jgi:hypothetical protein